MLLDRVPRQPFGVLADRIGGRRGSSRVRHALALFLLAALIGLSPFAHASPPDPIWVPGIYDGADYDDVIVLITGVEGVVDLAPVALRPVSRVVGLLAPLSVSGPSHAPALAVHLRSPPSA